MTARSILILGGARSGKTRRALALAEAFARRFYVATAEALDEEMSSRIAQHRHERGEVWTTIEAPLDLTQAIRGIGDAGAVCLVDCLTLWLSNLMGAGRDVAAATQDLCKALREATPKLILVSNEVGLGLVPETPLGRAFRDHQGRLNQAVAAIADEVEFVAAGLPVRLKP
ncbi:MAG: bifunctional adenosylcobinamide kinase/adenosylcobinamide-phosphate guanylyltransferase [Rhodomicrobiaceae bacterium]